MCVPFGKGQLPRRQLCQTERPEGSGVQFDDVGVAEDVVALDGLAGIAIGPPDAGVTELFWQVAVDGPGQTQNG